MYITKITSNGGITIPKKIRDQLRLKQGDIVDFEVEKGNTIRIIKRKKSYKEAYGMFYREGMKPLTVEEMDEGVAQYMRQKWGDHRKRNKTVT